MKNTITCKKCGNEIEVSEAFAHQIEESVRLEESKKFQQKKEEFEKQIKEKFEREIKETLSKELKEKDEYIISLKERASKAEEEELKLRKVKRELEEAKEKFRVEKERQLDEERLAIRKEIEEKDKMKFLEYEKKIADMQKSLEEARQKGDQKSQQLQGEVLELDLERLLKEVFLDDEIIPVGKGKSGGDIIHKVRGKSGRLAGIILWEAKRAKWSTSWIAKLKEDIKTEGATVAILVATDLPKEIESFQINGAVVITSYQYALALASILRRFILQIAVTKQMASSAHENFEQLYEYLQSDSFRHRFESFAEGIVGMQSDLEYEKNAMERIWKKRETQIKKMQLNASRMYGELQGIVGNALPDIKVFSLPDGESHES